MVDVKKKIGSYSYKRKGKIIRVPTHSRTYHVSKKRPQPPQQIVERETKERIIERELPKVYLIPDRPVIDIDRRQAVALKHQQLVEEGKIKARTKKKGEFVSPRARVVDWRYLKND